METGSKVRDPSNDHIKLVLSLGYKCGATIAYLQGTLEEKVFQRQVSKQGLSGVVVDAKVTNSSPRFSPEELKVTNASRWTTEQISFFNWHHAVVFGTLCTVESPEKKFWFGKQWNLD